MLHDFDYTPFIDALKKVFKGMEDEYNRISGQYGFKCSGCEESCCLTLFFHHTMLEHIYLEKGFKTLSPDTQAEVLERAGSVAEETEKTLVKGETPKIMCPLNKEGLCILYEYRPMVCRLHGIEHELTRPGQTPVRSPGCSLFAEQTRGMPYIPFDRTPHYMAMAKLEKELRLASGFDNKLKHTIAGMLLL